MPEPIRPTLDRHAFATAGMAFIESPERTDAGRVRDAVHAYLYTVANIRPADVRAFGPAPTTVEVRVYPSWAEVRDYLAEVRW